MNAPINKTAIDTSNLSEILARAQQRAVDLDLKFTGSITPPEAWSLVQQEQAILVDVRTNEERKFVGFVASSIHVPWATGTSFNRNPRFLKELENKTGKDTLILLLCRSGKRSALAAEAAFRAGFSQIYNVLEGFEGDLDQNNQRNHENGWRKHALPWQQD